MTARLATTPPPRPPVRAWRVMHAAEATLRLGAVLEAQRAVGMRPCLVTPAGAVAAEDFLHALPAAASRSSLLGSWGEVRQWRHRMLELDPGGSSDVVHAHTFAAGMAAVRNFPAVVYELERFIDEHAAKEQADDPPGPWLSRSFRVAEQFVLARAAAVVVHSPGARDGALERGASQESVFLIRPAEDADEAGLRAMGESYDAVYRHVALRRGPRRPGNDLPMLRPAQAY